MSPKWFLLLGICLQSFLVAWDRPTTLHALIIKNTSEPNGKIASTADANRMTELLQAISRKGKLQLKLTSLDINRLGPSTFESWIRSIKKNSVVFMYYSGAPRKSSEKTDWPSITFHGCMCQWGHPLSQERFTKRILKQDPKLAIVLFDCYTKPLSTSHHLSTPGCFKGRLPNVKALFLRNKGYIMAASVPENGCFACSTTHEPLGGVFTTKFLSGLHHVAKSPGSAWSNMTHVMYGCAGCSASGVRKHFAFNITSEVPCHHYR